ncbi:MAG: sugar ABC transporter permease [Clostridia bacterium]|nr:sugar ABC transporter permease [Clostridia bacterium]
MTDEEMDRLELDIENDNTEFLTDVDIDTPAGYVSPFASQGSDDLMFSDESAGNVAAPVYTGETKIEHLADPGVEGKTHMSQKAKNTVVNTIIHIVLVIICVVWILPFVGIVLESFRCESTGPVGYIIPQQWGFDNYVRLFTETKFGTWFLDTFIMGICTAVVQTVFVMFTAYALSRNRFKGRKFIMNLILVFGMFPGFLTLILLYTWMSDWNLTMANAPWGLIIIYVASSGMGYYIAKGFFDTISHSLDEAAKIDGASQLQIFWKIILPLSKPTLIYTILMGFMAPWGDFVTASFMANGASSGYNVAAGLQWLISDTMKNDYYTTFCAGGVVVAVPITILFLFLQKYYVAGVTGGAVKG